MRWLAGVIVLATAFLGVGATSAQAKTVEPLRAACWNVGVLEGSSLAGIEDPNITGQLTLAAWRSVRDAKQKLPGSTVRRFTRTLDHRAVGSLCNEMEPAVYGRAVDSGRAIKSGFGLDGPCNTFRAHEGLAFLHERANTVTAEERQQLEQERLACSSAQTN